MSNNNAFTSLVGHLAKVRAEGVNRSRLSVSKLITDSVTQSSGSAKPAASHELRSQSLNSIGTTHSGLRFGSPSATRTAAAQGTSEWAHLLKQTASGGLASAFGGGGGLLSTVSGIGGLVSSIVGLFGGSHKPLTPLSLFALSSSQDHELSVSNTQGGTQAGVVQSGAYAVQPASSTSQLDHQPYQFQSAQIAQAVKQALLNSSSLNDVIAEI